MTNYSKWMQENLGTIGDRKLRDIIMPGSHDAAMYRTTNCTVGAGDGNAKTQSQRFSGQLEHFPLVVNRDSLGSRDSRFFG